MFRRLFALALFASQPALPALAQQGEALDQSDRRLAQLAERMQAANAPLCRQLMPLTGMIVFSADQFGQPPPLVFTDGRVTVAQVLPGSAAQAAGVQANDAVVTVDGEDTQVPEPEGGFTLRDSTFDIIARHDPEEPLVLGLRRAGDELQVRLVAPAGCRALVEVVPGQNGLARSDGRVIQISWRHVASWTDDELAAIFAHELAHLVLEHRRRLASAGVDGGLLGEFGRNRRLRRQVEQEADLLSVHLLANAGYDAQIAPRFWRSETGSRFDAGILRSGAYASPRERARMMEAEIATYLTGAPLPSMPEHLLSGRDLPFAAR